MKQNTMQALNAALDANVPVLLTGAPGTAKTAMVASIAAARGLPLTSINLSHYEPADVNGWLVPGEGEVMHRRLPDWLAAACDAPHMFLLDELSCAPPAVVAAALRLVQERKAGARSLHPETLIIAASNPPEQAAGGWDIPAPMANRLLHLAWEPDFERWAGWFSANGPGTAKSRGAVVGYLQKVGAMSHLLQVPGSEAGSGGAWPSPRSWTNLAACLTGNEEIDFLLANGTVGEGEGTAFIAWRREQDLPDPEKLLRDPEGWDIPRRHDRAYASLAAVVGAVAENCNTKRWTAALRIHRLVLEAGVADLAAASAMPLLRMKLGSPDEKKKALAKAPLPAEELAAFTPLLKAAGLLGGSK